MKILVPSDGSKPSLRAAQYAADLHAALRSPAEAVTLISVHDDVGLRRAKSIVGSDAVAEYLRGESEKELQPAVELLAKLGVPTRIECRTGHIAEEIGRFAKEGGFALIVLGSKGRSAVSDMLLGSVAKRLIEASEIPVTIVK